MKTKLAKILNYLENGNISEQEAKTFLLRDLFDVSYSDTHNTLNDFIIEALQISNDKKRLPLIIQCPNGLEVYPSIKMKFENYGSPILGDKLEAMSISWC